MPRSQHYQLTKNKRKPGQRSLSAWTRHIRDHPRYGHNHHHQKRNTKKSQGALEKPTPLLRTDAYPEIAFMRHGIDRTFSLSHTQTLRVFDYNESAHAHFDQRKNNVHEYIILRLLRVVERPHLLPLRAVERAELAGGREGEGTLCLRRALAQVYGDTRSVCTSARPIEAKRNPPSLYTSTIVTRRGASPI